MDDNTLLTHVREVLGQIIEEDVSKISPKTHLRDDLGVDSMMAVELAYLFSQRFEKDMPFERWFIGQATTGDYTVQALMDFLKRHVG